MKPATETLHLTHRHRSVAALLQAKLYLQCFVLAFLIPELFTYLLLDLLLNALQVLHRILKAHYFPLHIGRDLHDSSEYSPNIESLVVFYLSD